MKNNKTRFSCRVTKVRLQNTLIIFNTYCYSTATMVTRTCLSVTLYVHWLSCSMQYVIILMAQTTLRVTGNSSLTRTFFMEGHWSYETTFTRPSKNFTKREQSPQGPQRQIIKISSPPPTTCLNSHRDFRHYKWFQQESLLSFLPTAPNKTVVQSHE